MKQIITSIVVLLILLATIVYFSPSDQFEPHMERISEVSVGVKPSDELRHETTEIKTPMSLIEGATGNLKDIDEKPLINVEILLTMKYEEIPDVLNPDNVDCNNYESLEMHPQVLEFEEFKLNNMFFNYEKLKPYTFYDDETLKTFAESGDSLAMYVLGLNYTWRAAHGEGIHIDLRQDRDRFNFPSQAEYDEDLMNEGQYWLMKVASGEYPTAIIQLISAVSSTNFVLHRLIATNDRLLATNNESLSEDEIAEIEAKIRQSAHNRFALFKLMTSTQPLLSKLPGLSSEIGKQLEKLPEEDVRAIERTSKTLLDNWKSSRIEQGYSDIVEYEISLEDLLLADTKVRFIEICKSR